MRIIKEIGRNPQLDWIAIITVSGLVGLVLVLGGVYLYNAIITGTIQATPSQEGLVKSIDEKTFTSVTQSFSKKDQATKRVVAGYDGPGDPAI
jgi:ATP phosphoribosyltransferase regulatory subunit HisZ